MELVFIRMGLGIIALLGTLHLLYTFLDLKDPKRFAPTDAKLLPLMQNTGIRLVRNPPKGGSFWKSYMGFNLSHSVGLLVFAALYSGLSLIAPETIFHPFFATVLIGTGLAYVLMSHFFWFSIPFWGSTLATSLFVAGTALHLGL